MISTWLKKRTLPLVMGLLLSAWACGDPSERVCTPGTVQFCPCVGGAAGVQSCNASGTGYEACECSGRDDDGTPADTARDGEGGKDAWVDHDASSDADDRDAVDHDLATQDAMDDGDIGVAPDLTDAVDEGPDAADEGLDAVADPDADPDLPLPGDVSGDPGDSFQDLLDPVDNAPDLSGEVAADLPVDLPEAEDAFPDPAATDGNAPDTPQDLAPEVVPCEEGHRWCTADGQMALRCQDGQTVPTACLQDQGRLCENGDCVDPWRHGQPTWSTCPDVQGGTPQTLAQKAAHFDAVATRLHLRPDSLNVASVTLKKVPTTCSGGATSPCFVAPPDDATATRDDVATWHTGESDGLWNGLYLASQAYRYGATRSGEALATIRLLLAGEVTRMRITGVPGLFARQVIPPDLAGFACPADPAFVPDPEKDDVGWVRVLDTGCLGTMSSVSNGQWISSERCGLDEFKGWCFSDNVSSDEYAGHVLALGAVFKLVDDPEIRATAADLLAQVSDHLARNWLRIVDWDGRATEHGDLHALSFDRAPASLAAMAMEFVLAGAVAGGRADLMAFYQDCLLQAHGPCAGWPYVEEGPYPSYLPDIGPYAGVEGCTSNYNELSKDLASLHTLAWFDRDPVLHPIIQRSLDEGLVRRSGQPRALIVQRNPWVDFAFAAFKPLGPGSDGPAAQAVEDAVCSLKQFPATKVGTAHDSASSHPAYCQGRFGQYMSEFPVPIQERCVSTFEWWSDPYDRETCADDPWTIHLPADYLLPYWMGRYFGFIPEGL